MDLNFDQILIEAGANVIPFEIGARTDPKS